VNLTARTDLLNRAGAVIAVLHPHRETGAVAIVPPDGGHDRLVVA
jgi:hypothetical protein